MSKKWLFSLLSLFILAALGFFWLKPNGSLRQQIRVLKENQKNEQLVQKYLFEGEGHFCHLDPSLTEKKLKEILDQPFTFLAKGKQTEVYESLDGQYVLRCLVPKKWKKKAKGKVAALLKRALLAWDTIREETGLLAIAQTPEGIELPQLTLLNSRGELISLAPEKIAFFLQKKATPLKKSFVQAAYEQDQKTMEELIRSLFHLLTSMREKQVIDLDGALIRNGNLGVIPTNQVILLDIGKLSPNHNKMAQTMKDIERLRPFYHWLFTYNKELVPLFLKCQEEYQNSAH